MKRLLVLFAVAALVLTVVGCAPKPAPTTPTTPTAPTTPTTPTTPTAPPKEKVLVVALSGEIESLDNQQTLGPMKNVIIQIGDWTWWNYETVTLPDGRMTVDTSKFAPALVTHYDVENLPDGRVKYTLHIRKDAVHASGYPVTAEDFAKTMFRRAKFKRDASERTQNHIFGTEPGVLEVVDEKTLNIYAKAPSTDDMFLHLGPMRLIYDWKTIEEKKDPKDEDALEYLKRNFPSSGPYKLDQWVKGVEIVLVRNDKWWGVNEGMRPYFDKMVFRIIPSEADRVMLLRRGEVDFATDISAKEALAMKGAAGVRVETYPSQEYLYAGMNVAFPPFDNVLVRKALNYAFPYQTVLDRVYQGAARRFYGALPQGCRAAPTEPAYTTNLATARSLLEQAGYKDGLKLTLTINESSPTHEEVAVYFQANLRQIGVDLEIQKVPPAVFSAETRARKVPFMLDQTLWWVNEPLFMLSQSFRSDQHANIAGYKNDRVDELLFGALKEADYSKRHAMYEEVVQLVQEDAAWIFIAQPDFVLAMRDDLEGYVAQNTQLHHLWLLRRKE